MTWEHELFGALRVAAYNLGFSEIWVELHSLNPERDSFVKESADLLIPDDLTVGKGMVDNVDESL